MTPEQMWDELDLLTETDVLALRDRAFHYWKMGQWALRAADQVMKMSLDDDAIGLALRI